MFRPLALVLTLALAPVLPASAQQWALDGYDAVGFAEQGRAMPGRPDIATMWKGKIWHFATEENRTRFEADPRAFAPGFNGLCPVALADGRQVPGDPRHVVVIGNKLYLLRSDRDERRLMAAPAQVLDKARAVWAQLR